MVEIEKVWIQFVKLLLYGWSIKSVGPLCKTNIVMAELKKSMDPLCKTSVVMVEL